MILQAAIASREIEIAWGHNREDKNFRNLKGTFGQLFEEKALLSEFAVGDKDGTCILSGVIVGGGGQRIAKNMTKNCLVMFDHDTGETVDEIAEKIENAGLFAVLWTTYSHMQPETMVSEDALLKWLRKSGQKTDQITATQVVDFLVETKKIKPAVFAGDLTLTRVHVEGGMKYRLTHAPMPRVRSMFLLDAPFDFAQRGGSQLAAIQEWKERYAGLAHMLGVAWDRSCVDPSRLMYTPRVAPGTDLAALGHEIRVIPGKLLDIDAIPRLDTERQVSRRLVPHGTTLEASDLAALLKGNKGDASEHDRRTFKTPGLLKFLKEHAHDFEAAEWLRSNFPDDVRHDYGNKIEFLCPNESNHTEQKADDRAFMVADASVSESGFHMGCLHNSCIEASKKDRAWYLDRLCERYCVSVADLSEFCPKVEATKDKRAQLKSIIESGTFASDYPDADSRRDLMARIAKAWPGEADRKTFARTMARALGSGELRHALLREMKEAEKTGADTLDNPNTYDGPIDCDWDAKTQLDVAVSQLHRVNQSNPRLFRGAAAPVVRVLKTASGVVLQKVESSAQWRNVLTTSLVFDSGKHFPKDLVDCIKGDTSFSFPVLSRVIDVPVFAPDGTLHTAAGYYGEIEAWLEPAIDYHDVPDVIAADDFRKAREWIDEAIRDFPFSDVCGGGETEPIYVEGSDDGEGWKLPNLKRGVSSRAHFYALMLNGFIVDLVGGVTPLFHIDKDKFNTGATLLANVALITLMGKAPAQSMDHKGDGEQEKRITANLKAGLPAVLMDNINDTLMGGSLAAMLTAQYVSQRLLGGNENLVAKNRITWITTGTGTEFSKEVLRRVLPIFLDAGEADPKIRAQRGDIKRTSLETWLTENRASLVWSCHVLIRYALQNGLLAKAETYNGPIIDSFGRWCAVMGTLLRLIGVPGFLGNLEAFGSAKADEDEAQTDIAYELWKAFTSGKPEPEKFTAKRAWENIGPQIAGLTGALRSEHAGITEMGKRLNKVRGVQVFAAGEDDGAVMRVRIERTTACGRARYRVVEV